MCVSSMGCCARLQCIVLCCIIGGSCHKCHFCRDKYSSRQTRVCRDLLLSRQTRVCRDLLLSRQNTSFVTTKMILVAAPANDSVVSWRSALSCAVRLCSTALCCICRIVLCRIVLCSVAFYRDAFGWGVPCRTDIISKGFPQTRVNLNRIYPSNLRLKFSRPF